MNHNEKKQFLAGWEVKLDGKEHCQSFIETQLIDEETAKRIETYIELNFDTHNLLSDAKLYFDNKLETKGHLLKVLEIDQAIGQLKYRALKNNQIIDFDVDEKGIHFLGGDIPDDFTMPENKCPGSFQYLGKIFNSDPLMNWLPFDLQLICPIYLDIYRVWVDYSNPNHPIVMNKEEIDSTGTAYSALKEDSFITFNKTNFSLNIVKEYPYNLGFSGVPNWIQYPDIPRCPKTNNTMKFLCQLSSEVGVTTKETNIDYTIDGYSTNYFEELNFWGDGDLFVFFEPTSKIACYFIQNT